MKASLYGCTLIHCVCATLMINSVYSIDQSHREAPALTIETSLGDIVDKILVLKIKQDHIQDDAKRANIQKELQLLQEIYLASIQPSKQLDELAAHLLRVNKNLWYLEDAVRLKEHEKCFDKEFIAIVDSILKNNDERACIKRTINLLGNSPIIEEKSYAHIKEVDIEDCSQTDIKQPVSLTIPLPLGDLVDRITILLIKKEQIKDASKLFNITTEYNTLNETLKTTVEVSATLEVLFDDLLKVNKDLWNIQNKLRIKKRDNIFDAEFIELARSVYYVNDKRCAIKKQINNLFGSQLIEEKCYTNY